MGYLHYLHNTYQVTKPNVNPTGPHQFRVGKKPSPIANHGKSQKFHPVSIWTASYTIGWAGGDDVPSWTGLVENRWTLPNQLGMAQGPK